MQAPDIPSALRQVEEVIRQHQTFVLTTHVNPDGDALGSELALARGLRQLGKQVTILNHSATPANYLWLDPDHAILPFVPERHRDILLAAEVIFILDANQPERLRSLEPFIHQSTGVKVIIDHHLEPHAFGTHLVIDDDATSTGEIVYLILKDLEGVTIDREIAQALYTAIMTDTGSFRYPRTDPAIHRIAAELLDRGVDPTEVYVKVYENWTSGRMRLLGEALDTLKTAYNGRIAWMVCTQQMFKATGTTEVETDNFTVYPMSIQGVVVGILFNELPNGVKISFRSKGDLPINMLAKEFGGNGHLNAAGTRLFNATLEDIIPAVIEKAGKYITQEETNSQ
jgi:phosphoesterase RecJ-like protein